MSEIFSLATHKGLLRYRRDAHGQWQIVHRAFLGDPLSALLTDPRSGARFAALNLGHFGVKLHRAPAGGDDWQEISAPKFPTTGEEEGPSVKQVWILAASNDDRPGTLWAGCIPAGLFKSEDHGESWSLISSLWGRPERREWFGGGFDEAGIHSIWVDPEDSMHLLIGISCGGVWESLDEGSAWTLQGRGLRAAYMPPERGDDRNIQDPHRLVVCPDDSRRAWIQHHNGIFRSDNGGRDWQEITEVRPSAFGFAVAVHPSKPDTAWFIPAVKDECRIPVDGKLVVTRTRDGGRSFDILDKGLPQAPAYDLVLRHAFDIDPSGQYLAFASTTGNLWLSEDQGDNWQCLSHHLPPVLALQFDP